MAGYEVSRDISMESLIENLPLKNRNEFNRIYYGRSDNESIRVKENSALIARELDLELQAYKFDAAPEQTRKPRILKVALIQHSIVITTDKNLEDQRKAIYKKVESIIEIAAYEGVNIVCLQEAWSMPFALSTRQIDPWIGFAESAQDGPSTKFLQAIAVKHKMVIISPIIEKDGDNIWNTAVVISENGKVIGKHRKNHLPSRGSFDETMWYAPGNTGHPVFDTTYGRIAINICYGRHHPQNWMMFGINGAEIVFNPSATIAEFGEAFWGIEARNAAIANNYFVCSINRVGTEVFNMENSIISRSYYGSSYITAPDGVRTPGLSRSRDGLLIGQFDLNLCRQIKDKWGFNTTRRLDLYAEAVQAICDSQNTG